MRVSCARGYNSGELVTTARDTSNNLLMDTVPLFLETKSLLPICEKTISTKRVRLVIVGAHRTGIYN